MTTDATDTTLREPPRVSGGVGENGHLDELSRDPIALMTRVRAECGDVGEFTLAGRDVVLLTGADANEFYFRAPEDQLDQAEAYPFMTPIFGKGIASAKPGLADSLVLAVDDLDAARADLVARGVAVSEVFHDAGGVFHHAGENARATVLEWLNALHPRAPRPERVSAESDAL